MKHHLKIDNDTYFGGKGASGVYQKIINQIPPHRVFISGFLGCCYVMRAKRPAQVNVGIDIDPKVIKYWERSRIKGHSLDLYNNGFIQSFEMIRHYYDPEHTFIYLDPPYPISSRSSQQAVYRFEFSNDNHIQLLDYILALPYRVAISTYPNELYQIRLKDWRKIEFQAKKRRGVGTEVLYMNYPAAEQLHDYTYLGDNFKRREKIKLKRKSMLEKIKKLSTLERQALFFEINQTYYADQRQKPLPG